MKKAINNYLNQYKEIYNKELFFDDSNEAQNSSNSLQDYYHEIKNCVKCQLSKNRKNFVFGVGNPNSDIVFVGEAPGKNEDLIGEPFVGRSGKLLDKILGAVNLSRDKVFILNVVKCRPPENRAPNSSEIDKCEPYLKKQLKIIKPKLIVALGRVSAMTLLKTKESLGDMRNKIHKYENVDLLVTYHPAALLRNPNLKGAAWEDFKYIKKEYLDV